MGTHKWEFLPRFRRNGYSWKGSTLAAKRLREALSEIKAVRRKNPALAGEGTVILMEKIWPSFQHIDTSSGALGSAVDKAVNALVDILARIEVDDSTRETWLEHLWAAVTDDGVDYLAPVRERWGELCVTPERASRYADTFLVQLHLAWSDKQHGYFMGAPACMSCLLMAARYEELLKLIDRASLVWWHYRHYGVQALMAMGETDRTIEYAEASRGFNDPYGPIAAACEAILLNAGRSEEAYQQYAVVANQAGTYLSTCRRICEQISAALGVLDPRRFLGFLQLNVHQIIFCLNGIPEDSCTTT